MGMLYVARGGDVIATPAMTTALRLATDITTHRYSILIVQLFVTVLIKLSIVMY
jgi:hypothetical protein